MKIYIVKFRVITRPGSLSYVLGDVVAVRRLGRLETGPRSLTGLNLAGIRFVGSDVVTAGGRVFWSFPVVGLRVLWESIMWDSKILMT